MYADLFHAPMPSLPRRGQRVRWRDARHVHLLGWSEAYGDGPFEVLGVVDHRAQDIPNGLVLHTRRGEREINEVWLELVEERRGGGEGAGEVA